MVSPQATKDTQHSGQFPSSTTRVNGKPNVTTHDSCCDIIHKSNSGRDELKDGMYLFGSEGDAKQPLPDSAIAGGGHTRRKGTMKI